MTAGDHSGPPTAPARPSRPAVPVDVGGPTGAASWPTNAAAGAAAFLGMADGPRSDVATWDLAITAGLTGGRGNLFGGCGMGAAVLGLERLTGRPLVWMTTQFLAATSPPQVLHFEVVDLVEGRNMSQASVTASVDGRTVLGMQASLGARPGEPQRRWDSAAPPAQTPDAWQEAESFSSGGGLRNRFSCRQVTLPASPTDTGRSLWWFGADGVDLGNPAMLAIVADFVPMGLTAALGRPVFGASLDNTVRVVDRAETDWVLAEMVVQTVIAGVAHVGCRVWSASGALLVIASQTCVVSERLVPG